MNADTFCNLSISKPNRMLYIEAKNFTNLPEDNVMFYMKLFDGTKIRKHEVLAQQKLCLLQLVNQ